MPRRARSLAALATVAAALAAQPAFAANVKVTPLGSHDGEFCRFDRAMVFEDPDGTRLLYDAGRTVAGADDPRLGDIDADRHIPAVNAGSCAEPDVSSVAAPDTSSVRIAIAKEAVMVTGSEMARFFAAKLGALGGDPGASQLVRFGATRVVGGVAVTTVPATHSNGINPAFLDGALGEMLKSAGLTAYAGPPTGYVLTFSNGLAVYLSGDTGLSSEQDTTVRQHYDAKLAVVNIGDTYTTGPEEAAWVMNELVRPASVIASHANQASTEGGKVIPGTKTDTFVRATHAPVHLPLSGRTMEFDAGGRCVAGC